MATETTINLTDSARQHVEKVLAKDKNGIGLRVRVKTTGCSGYQYAIETAKEINGEDKEIVSNDIKIIVDEKSLSFLAGTELDFTNDGLKSGFKFDNPNAQQSCGCGESFSLKKGMEK